MLFLIVFIALVILPPLVYARLAYGKWGYCPDDSDA